MRRSPSGAAATALTGAPLARNARSEPAPAPAIFQRGSRVCQRRRAVEGPTAPARAGCDTPAIHQHGPIAQHREHRFAEPKVAGGIPAGVAIYRCSSARESIGLRSQRPAVQLRPAMPDGSVAQQKSTRLSTGRSREQHPSEPPHKKAEALVVGRKPSASVSEGHLRGLGWRLRSRNCSVPYAGWSNVGGRSPLKRDGSGSNPDPATIVG